MHGGKFIALCFELSDLTTLHSLKHKTWSSWASASPEKDIWL